MLFAGAAVPVYVLVQAVISFVRTQSGRVDLVLKAVACLGAWLGASFCMLFVAFFTFYGSAHVAGRQSGQDGIARTLILLSILYVFAAVGVVFWTWRWMRQAPARQYGA
jgi:hypothetical protein